MCRVRHRSVIVFKRLSSFQPKPSELPQTADGMRAQGAAWPTFERMIRRFADTITRDGDHQHDVVESAMVELWEAAVCQRPVV